MAESMSGTKFSLKLTGTLNNALTDGTPTTASCPNVSYSDSISNGVGSGCADRSWQQKNGELANHEDQVTLCLYDFAGVDIGAGAGKDPLGQDMAFQNVVAIVIVNENAAGAAGHLEVLPASSHGWTPIGSHTVAAGSSIGPQGILMKYEPEEGGLDIDPNVSDRLTLRANGGAVTYSIYLLARTSDTESSSSSSSVSSSSVSISSLSSSSLSSLSSSSASSSSSSISTSSSSQSMSTSSSSSISTSSISTSLSSSSGSSGSSSSLSSISSSSSSSSSHSSSSVT